MGRCQVSFILLFAKLDTLQTRTLACWVPAASRLGTNRGSLHCTSESLLMAKR